LAGARVQADRGVRLATMSGQNSIMRAASASASLMAPTKAAGQEVEATALSLLTENG
jgi:hypothetical protein